MSILFGSIIPMEIACGDEKKIIDKNVYLAALKHAPAGDWSHSITPIIDNIEYPVYETIIEFIYFAALPSTFVQKIYKPYDHSALIKIPEFLAIISWCDTFLKPSASYNSFVSEVKKLILLAVSIIRAIVSNDFIKNTCADRIALLSSVELKNIVPLLPVPPIADMNVILSKDKKTEIESNYKKYSKSFPALYMDVVKIDSIKAYTDTLLVTKYIWELWRCGFRSTQPRYMHIENFGPDCADMIKKLFDTTEIECGNYDITDVFRNGIVQRAK